MIERPLSRFLWLFSRQLCNLPVFRNGFVSLDDDTCIVRNLHIRSLDGDLLRWALFDYKTNLWHPLTWISHAVDYAVWGLNPIGHHLTNVVLHALNTCIVVLLTIGLLKTARERMAALGGQDALDDRALMIAGGVTGLLFGIHPLHVESVAWAVERKDVLYAIFYLLSIGSYIRYANSLRAAAANVAPVVKAPFYLSLLLFTLSLCSKPMAVTLPVVLLLLDWYPLKRIAGWRDLIPVMREKLPFLLLSLIVSGFTVMAEQATGGFTSLEKLPLATRLLALCSAFGVYFKNFLAPLHLLPFYPYPKDVAFSQPAYVAAMLGTIAIAAFCLFTAKKQPLWSAALAYFVITLFPVLGIFLVGGQFIADRYVYLPSLSVLSSWDLVQPNYGCIPTGSGIAVECSGASG